MTLTLWQKGFILVCVPLFCELLFVGLLTLLLHQAEAEVERERLAKNILWHQQKLSMRLMDGIRQIGSYAITNGSTFIEAYEKDATEINPELDELEKLLRNGSKEHLEGVRRTREIANQLMHGLEETRMQIIRDDRSNAFINLARLNTLLQELPLALADISAQQRAIEQQSPVAQQKTRTLLVYILIAGVGLNFVVAIFLAQFFNKGISQRLSVLAENTIRLSAGKPLNPPISGQDEIANLDKSFTEMAKALAISAKRERAALDNAVDLICSIDAAGKFTAASSASQQLLGVSPDEIVGSRYLSLIPEEDVEDTRTAVHSAMSQEGQSEFESRLRHRDGSVRDVLWSAQWSPSESSLFCVIHDITERKRSENLLRLSERRVQLILSSLPIGLLIIDEAGMIETVNEATESMFASPAGELTGKSMPQLLNCTAAKFQNLVQELVVKPGSLVKAEGFKSDGNRFPIEMSLNRFYALDGPRLLSVVIDATDKEELERMKQAFVAMVSHDLRTPLTSIRGCLTMLTLGRFGELSIAGKTAVTAADRSTKRLIALINDLLDLEKLEAGKLELEIAEIPLKSVLDASIEAVSSLAEEQQVALKVLPCNSTIAGDQERLIQVVVNLLSNAIKFSPANTAVIISSQQEDTACKISVTDHGPGIPTEYRSAIFDRFEQVGKTKATRKGGTGLGLAICKSIVEQHGGMIGVDSEIEKGSTFWFTIPLFSPPTDPTEPSEQVEATECTA